MTVSDDLRALAAQPTRYLDHADPALRRLAVAACGDAVVADDVIARHLRELLATDDDDYVRAAAAETLAHTGEEALGPLLGAGDDPSPVVVEAVATALGELERPEALPWLEAIARSHTERLVRESAVASLGAIGDPRAVPALIDIASSAPPQVRRRAIAALSVFEGPEVEAALRTALEDRNPMVREAAEQVVR